MKKIVLIDTGPLVALVNRRDHRHNWVVNTVSSLSAPFLTCEPVITEACFLVQSIYGAEDAIMGMISSKKLVIPFDLSEEITRIRELMQRYQSVPMSLADACLVRMNELLSGSTLLTLDSDFLIYRKNKNEMMDLIVPDDLLQ